MQALDTSVAQTGPDIRGLLRLPAELRNQIYELAIERNTDIIPYKSVGARAVHEYKNGIRRCLNCIPRTRVVAIPPLLQSCQIIRYEALPIYYAQNRFFLDLRDGRKNYARSCKLLQATEARGIAAMTSVVILGSVQSSMAHMEQTDRCCFSFAMVVDFFSPGKALKFRRWDRSSEDLESDFDAPCIGRLKTLVNEFKVNATDQGWDEARYQVEMVDLLRDMHGETQKQ